MPLSLVLFLLYVEPIVKKHGIKRSSYIDDIVSTYAAENISIVYEKLKKDYIALLEYRELEGSPFNPKKIEV